MKVNKLCACGCGGYVKTSTARYIRGHNNKDPISRAKTKKTMIERYGYDNAFKNKSIQEKYRNTMVEKYGSDNPSKLENVKKQKKLTCMKNHGVEVPYQSLKIKEKIKETCLKKYNGIGFASNELNKKVQDTLIDVYGVDNYSKTIAFREFAKQLMIDRLNQQMENGDTVSPNIGRYEPTFFKWLKSLTKYEIIRPRKNMYGCFPDGYIEELNLVIEFDEPYHNEKVHTRRDEIKNEIYKLHKLNIFRVPQKEWEKDPDSIKEKFISLIESIENS